MHSQHKSALLCFFLLAKKEIQVIYFLQELQTIHRTSFLKRRKNKREQFFPKMDPFHQKNYPFLQKRSKNKELIQSHYKSALLCFFLLAKKEVRLIYYVFVFRSVFWMNPKKTDLVNQKLIQIFKN